MWRGWRGRVLTSRPSRSSRPRRSKARVKLQEMGRPMHRESDSFQDNVPMKVNTLLPSVLDKVFKGEL